MNKKVPSYTYMFEGRLHTYIYIYEAYYTYAYMYTKILEIFIYTFV